MALGCWRWSGLDVSGARSLVETALDLGMTLIDTADIYGIDGAEFGAAEVLLGHVLDEAPHLRDQVVVATKGGIRPGVPYDSSASGLVAACDASLGRLGVDVIDLYQVHRPDLLAHPAEVAGALDSLVDAGKVRSVGVSNHTPAQTRALGAHLTAPLVSVQPELSAAHLDPLLDGTGDLAMAIDLAVLAWSPLGGGRLASGQGVPAGLLAVLDDLARREEVDRATVALAFVLALPFRPVAILGTVHPERLREATRARSIHLDRGDVYRVLAAAGVPLP